SPSLCPPERSEGGRGPAKRGRGPRRAGQTRHPPSPLPPASASSGGRDLPPLRGGQSPSLCPPERSGGGRGPAKRGRGPRRAGQTRHPPSPLPPASASSGGRDLPPLRGGQSPALCPPERSEGGRGAAKRGRGPRSAGGTR